MITHDEQGKHRWVTDIALDVAKQKMLLYLPFMNLRKTKYFIRYF